MDISSNAFICSLFLSGVGMGYFAYGRDRNPVIRYAGLILMIFPYFVTNFWWLLIIGAFLMLAPYFINLS